MTDLKGVMAVLATPFDDAEVFDEAGMRQLIDWEVAAGVHGLVALGIFGEAPRLSDAERRRVTEVVIQHVGGRVPVVVGVGHNSSTAAARLADEARQLGADAVMVFPSPYARSGSAVASYFAAIVEAVDEVPIIIQDEPTFTGVPLSPELIAALMRRHPTITGVKLEEAPTPPKVTDLRSRCGSCAIFGGLGGTFFLEELRRGADGTMTGFAFPEVLVRVYEAHVSGDHQTARDAFFGVLPLIRYESQPGLSLALRKELLVMRGAMPGATIRQPARTLDETTRAELADLARSVEAAAGRT